MGLFTVGTKFTISIGVLQQGHGLTTTQSNNVWNQKKWQFDVSNSFHTEPLKLVFFTHKTDEVTEAVKEVNNFPKIAELNKFPGWGNCDIIELRIQKIVAAL